MITFRPFQRRAIDRTHDELTRVRSALAVMATGLGKTYFAAGVAAERMLYGRTLFLCHRDELVWQAVRAFTNVFDRRPDVQAGDEHGDMFTATAPVVVSTVQTQYSGYNGRGRMSLFDPNDFGTLIVDEAHHYIAPAFRRVIEYYMGNPRLSVVGLTATPDRADRLAMGRLFQAVACNYDLKWATSPGVSWLVPIDQYTGRLTDMDLSDVGEVAGELNAEQLATVMTRTGNLHGVVDHTLRQVGDRRTLVFAVPGSVEVNEKQIKHAQLLASIFNKRVPPKNGIPQAYFVHQKTPIADRRAMFKAYAQGAFQFLVNVGIATEGFDDPGVECVVVARPTMSRSLYTQMAGRATRPLSQCVDPYPLDEQWDDRRVSIAESSKPSCLLVDFEGNAGRHKLITGADILGGDYDSEVIARAKVKSSASDVATDLRELLETSRIEIERETKERADRLADLRVASDCLFQEVDPYDHSGNNVPNKRKTANAATGKRAGPPSPSQITYLSRHAPKGTDLSRMNMGEAGAMVGEIKRRFRLKLCSIAQANVLGKHALPRDVPREVAKHWIDRLAANKWRVPQDVRRDADKVARGEPVY